MGHQETKSRDYEYVVYTQGARHSGPTVKVTGGLVSGLPLAKTEAKRHGSPAAVYSITLGRFIGYVAQSGRFITFR